MCSDESNHEFSSSREENTEEYLNLQESRFVINCEGKKRLTAMDVHEKQMEERALALLEKEFLR